MTAVLERDAPQVEPIEVPPGAFTLPRPPRTRTELYWYVRLRFGFSIPWAESTDPVCREHGHVPPFVAFADAYFRENSINPEGGVKSLALWHGSRGLSGKSWMLSCLATVLAEVRGSQVNLLGGSLAQSENIAEHVGLMLDYERAPKFMVVKHGRTRITFTNGAFIRPLTASQRAVRGPHPQSLLLDEIDEMELKVLDGALGQPMAKTTYLNEVLAPYTVMCSTWQNAEGTFTTVLERAEEQQFPIYRWCYRESANEIDGWLTWEAIEEKRSSIPRIMWEVEYELGEPSIGNRAFHTPAVERVFSLDDKPIRKVTKKDYELKVYANPIRGARYVIAADWAKEVDYTVIAVFRVDGPFRTLAYYVRMRKRPYPFMYGHYNKAQKRYGAVGIHDATGVGKAVADQLDSRVRGFQMVGHDRADMLQEYLVEIERSGIDPDDPETQELEGESPKMLDQPWRFPRDLLSARKEHIYCSVDDMFSSGKDFHLPDTVCCFALAARASRRYVGLAGGELVRSAGDTGHNALTEIEDLTEGTPNHRNAPMPTEPEPSIVVRKDPNLSERPAGYDGGGWTLLVGGS